MTVIEETFFRAVVPFDNGSAPHYAAIVAARRSMERPITPLDPQIAAICRQHDAGLATRNVRDFDGLTSTVVNPWTDRTRSNSHNVTKVQRSAAAQRQTPVPNSWWGNY